MATINLSKALKARRGPIPLSQMLKGPPGFLERVGKHLAYPAIPPKGVELMPEHIHDSHERTDRARLSLAAQ